MKNPQKIKNKNAVKNYSQRIKITLNVGNQVLFVKLMRKQDITTTKPTYSYVCICPLYLNIL